MDDIQRSSSPKSKMVSSCRSRNMCCVLESNFTRKFAVDLSLQIFLIHYLLVRLWWNILVANLATNFQDLVAKVKNLVALAPVLNTISRPAPSVINIQFPFIISHLNNIHVFSAKIKEMIQFRCSSKAPKKMYREQYGEYAYWCKGVKGELLVLQGRIFLS